MELQYKTFDQLMASVEGGLENYADNNLIKRNKYIKVAREINAELGPKIFRKRELCIPVENFKATVPLDLSTVLCAVATTIETLGTLHGGIPGTRFETNTKEELVSKGITPWSCDARISCVNNCYWITKKTETTEIKYTNLFALVPSFTCLGKFHIDSPNRKFTGKYTIDITNSEISVNFEKGEIYLSYITDMVNESGDLLVLDHELINPYYENRIKKEIFLDLWNMGEDTYQKYVNIRDNELPPSRKRANQLIIDPGYRKMREHTNIMLCNYYNEFYKMFQ